MELRKSKDATKTLFMGLRREFYTSLPPQTQAHKRSFCFMGQKWIKLYTAILDDDRMITMSDSLWWTTIELFLVAEEKSGRLPSIGHISWRIRIEEDELFERLILLEKAGVVYRIFDEWFIKSQKELFFPTDPAYSNKRVKWAMIRKIIAPWVFFRHGSICAKCGATEDLTIDHIIPMARGGTNDLENLQILCRKCNSSKGAKL
jgi:5-methylcytosine-specific restriction endonuclease McrA